MSTREKLRVPPSGAFLTGGVVNDILTRNADGTASWKTPSVAAAPAPLKGTYFVDPTFVGTSTGSESNPFTTFGAAFAYALAQGLVAGTVFLAPGAAVVENVVMPSSGEWTLRGLSSPGNSTSCQITGNLDISGTASRRCWVGDLIVSGNVTGNTSAGTNRITFERVRIAGTTTLTISGGGVVRVGTLGGVAGTNIALSNMAYTFFTGAVAVQGTVWGSFASFQSTLSCSGRCTFFNVTFGGSITTTADVADDNDLFFDTCICAGIAINVSQSNPGRIAAINAQNTIIDSASLNYSGVGLNVCNLDSATANGMVQHGCTQTGSIVGGAGTMARIRLTGQVGNLGLSTLAFACPIPQMRANATLTLVTPGTAGAALLNVGYTDSLGVARVKPVTTALNVAGAAGDEAQGQLVFTQNGSAAFQYSVTGIVTPGALSYNLAISLEPGQ